MSITRYDTHVDNEGFSCAIENNEDGDYVLYSDHVSDIDRLTAELVRANKYKQELSTELTAYMIACESLKGQLSGERIRAEKAEAERDAYKLQHDQMAAVYKGMVDNVDLACDMEVKRIVRVTAERDRYREALERIAKRGAYCPYEIAREALSKEEI